MRPFSIRRPRVGATLSGPRRPSLAAISPDVLELRAFARMDFRVDDHGRAWLTDVGVSPGLAPDNSAFSSVFELGFDYPSFLRLVGAATLGSRGLLRFPSSIGE